MHPLVFVRSVSRKYKRDSYKMIHFPLCQGFVMHGAIEYASDQEIFANTRAGADLQLGGEVRQQVREGRLSNGNEGDEQQGKPNREFRLTKDNQKS